MGVHKFAAVGFALIFIANSAFAEGTAVKMAAPPGPPMLEVFRRATVSLGAIVTLNGKSQFQTKGSGIVIADSSDRACLLTARHMFYSPEDNWLPTQVNLRLPPESSQDSADNGTVLPLVMDGRNLWTAAEDGADLAVIPLPKIAKTHTALSVSAFGSASDVYQGASILVLGYPALLGEGFLTTPYARGGIISWVDIADPGNRPFLVDSNLYPGNSGGPVFRVRNGFEPDGGYVLGGGAVLIGIVSKGAVESASVVAGGVPIQATNTQTGKVNPAIAMVLGIGGIGVIEPVTRAKLIIQNCLHPAGIPSTGG